MRSSKTRKPLTRAEIAAAYRRRQAQEKRQELKELVALAYQLGRKQAHTQAIPAGRLLAELRDIRAAQSAAKTSKKAAAYLALLADTKPVNVKDIREALTNEKAKA